MRRDDQQNIIMRDTRIKQSCQMYMSNRSKNASKNANVIATNANANANVVATSSSTTRATLTNDVVRTRVAQRNDETNDAYTRRVNEIVALIATLYDATNRCNDRDAKSIRRALRSRDYYIHRFDRTSRASQCVVDAIARANA